MTTATATLRVFAVDDHPAVRAGLASLLAAEDGLELVGSAATVREALEQCAQLRPDVVVLDVHLPDGDGLALCLRLQAGPTPAPAVLLYTAFADDRLAVAAVVAGARGLMGKSAEPDALTRAIRAVAQGTSMLPPPSPEALAVSATRLDPQDVPALGMLLHGTPPEDIARTLAVADSWLGARRWAMLERLSGGRGASRRRAG
jgi:DNA-binding NarL/FixJ family response regulator